MRNVLFHDLGKIAYPEAWQLQQDLLRQVIETKLDNRKRIAEGLPPLPQQSHLIFCEHPHVYTLGRNGDIGHLLLDNEGLEQHQASFFQINRGGDITYHGDGQLVGYPIFDLDEFFTDIGRYIRMLEEAVIRVLALYGIPAGRVNGQSGVWLDEDKPTARKICAIGVHLSRWVTMHGFAFNVNTDLSYFNHIIPCGIQDKGVTSLKSELGKEIPMNEVKKYLFSTLQELFEFNVIR